eukprot:TRINITY_DN990_c3_g1_i1.p1 TRINITY_DN990_c3_g1~~TRINITY_DN990_c3_g1_i1.p1  ORF type:complete len:226 (+),score=38.04 TRINITY_DN990_c3_g1_i1:80-679(+)
MVSSGITYEQVEQLSTPRGSPTDTDLDHLRATPDSQASLSTESSAKSDSTCREATPCCDHNDWDNVRVNKKVMTLRCRVCQKQWRMRVEVVWNTWKCEVYSSNNGKCHSDCKKLHINYRKQNLETRFQIHGQVVIDHVRVGRAQSDVQTKIETLTRPGSGSSSPRTDPSAPPSPSLSSSSSSFTHDPYTWGVVSPPGWI